MDDLGKVKLCRGMVNIIFMSLATSTNLYLTFINIRYTCETDCTLFPETCISERLIMTIRYTNAFGLRHDDNFPVTVGGGG